MDSKLARVLNAVDEIDGYDINVQEDYEINNYGSSTDGIKNIYLRFSYYDKKEE